jgi:molybdopterin-containing oxidoreductase family iron-sulfur binding subunit
MSEPLLETVGRRTFLKVLGAVGPLAAVSACSPAQPEHLIPYLIPPEDDIPGVSTFYATSCRECPAGCGMTVRTREGRAVKLEGNPEHVVNLGSLCIRGQSALQGLYNPDRIRGAQRREVMNAAAGQSRLSPAKWEDGLAALVDRLKTVRQGGGASRIAISRRC